MYDFLTVWCFMYVYHRHWLQQQTSHFITFSIYIQNFRFKYMPIIMTSKTLVVCIRALSNKWTLQVFTRKLKIPWSELSETRLWSANLKPKQSFCWQIKILLLNEQFCWSKVLILQRKVILLNKGNNFSDKKYILRSYIPKY